MRLNLRAKTAWMGLVLFLGVLTAEGASVAKALRAGVHAVDISPKKFPIILSGGFLPYLVKEPAGSVHARSLVLDDGATRIAITVVDTLMMPRELLDEVKQAAAKTTGILADHMLISATHTHSAPPVMGALGTDANPEYSEFLRGRLVEAIEGAAREMRPARIGWSAVQAPEHTHCRRWILRPDKMLKDPFGDLTVRAHMHPGYQNPEFIGPSGPVDPGLTVVAVQSPEGKPVAVLANYSMHYVGTSAGVSPDYYGPFVEKVRRLLGVSDGDTGFVAMMSQGTSGDQHWMDYSQPKKEISIQVYADAMARKAFEAYRAIRYRDWVPLSIREKTLTLSRRVPDEKRLAWARQIVDALPDGKPRNLAEVYAREQILIAQEPRRELRLQAVRIGDLGIAAFPNEVFGITGLKIKAQSPLPVTFNIELANGADGYIPPPEQHKLGGYTTWPARTAGLEANAEPVIVETLLGLLEEVSGKPRRLLRDTQGDYAKAVLALKPAAYWRGNEIEGRKALDASGNSRTGEYTDGVALYLEGPDSPVFSGDGPVNRAPHFAGGHMKASLPGGGNSYTVTMWFYNGLPAGARAVTGDLFSRGNDLLRIDGAGRLGFVQGEQIVEGTKQIDLKTWNFVAMIREGSRVLAYLNGVETPEVSGAVKPAAQTSEIVIGAGAGKDSSFEGRIDEMAVFDRALKPAEVARLYRVVVR